MGPVDLESWFVAVIAKHLVQLIEIGYKVKQHQETQNPQPLDKKKPALADKHTEYLLRIMAITSDIYRCVRNENSKYKEKNVDQALERITLNTQKYIEGSLEKNR